MTIEQPLLYSFRRCPYAMRARMALHIAGVAHDTQEISLTNKPDALLTASPKATVPVLVLPDGRVIDESLDIMDWALGQSDPEHWLAARDNALIAAIDGPFKLHLDRAKYHASAADRDSALSILHRLEARLTGCDHLGGATRGFTDVALMPFVRQFAAIDRGWFAAQPLPGVQAWLAGLEASALFAAIMAKPSPPAAAPAP